MDQDVARRSSGPMASSRRRWPSIASWAAVTGRAASRPWLQVCTASSRSPGLAKRARKIFDTLKYTNIVVTINDGTLGWKEHAPYDGIIVTAAAPRPPKALLDQLAQGGRLVIPVGDESSQDIMVYIREDNDQLKEENRGGCRFVKLIGDQGWKE